MRAAIFALLALIALGGPDRTEALETTLGLGVADSHDGEYAGVLDISLRWQASGSIPLVDEHELLIGVVESRPLPALDRHTAYAGYGIRSRFGRFYTGVGLVAVDNTSEALSSWYQFVSTGGVHLGRVDLTLRHLSNSGFRGRNRGETYLSVGFNW